MTNTAKELLACGLVSLGMFGSACISEDSGVLDGARDCAEFTPGEEIDDDLDVSATVGEFMQAAADLTYLGDQTADEVLVACSGIALDLGAQDTWSELEAVGDQISNSAHTGACDAAGSLIEQSLIDAGEVNGRVAMSVTRGECHVDFDAQAECDAQCALEQVCDPGTIETRCEPGDLSVVCDTACEVDAYCVGTADVAANCMGACEAECVGECQGTCIAPDGTRTENDPNCVGKCTSACNGTCRGRCKIEADGGIECGADVHCEGGCTGSYSDPVCTSDYTPPECSVDEDCYASCTARALADAECDPTQVDIHVDVDKTPELEPLVAALEEHLPRLFDAAENKGPLAHDALQRLNDAGADIAADLGDLEGKELACVGVAADSVLATFAKFDVAVSASVDVTVTTSDHTD